ncbi:hypothetical protein HII28_18965 [Planctomonas sp. JC2975]|uniref:hypothetical protein n=1 Tax=Planctomonas sp. JC2975 TaxID=2729626 RepID=UPI001475C9FC|nr:hypothetical protein [Planctomonas sp. JC2975]NNC13948.1 hypothetical protein [Planctomonas sp. JC2975]
MNLFEIQYPQGALDERDREAIAEAILENLLVEPDAPPAALERAGGITQVYFVPVQTWRTGVDARPAAQPWPLVVNVTVPEVWLDDLSRRTIGAVRAAIASRAPQVDLGAEPKVWINVFGVAEGSIGMGGRPSSSTDIVRYLTEEVVVPGEQSLGDGVYVDPVCGMHVRVGDGAVTLDDHDTLVAFCATGCRDVYAEDHGLVFAS